MVAVSSDGAALAVANESGIANLWRLSDLAHVTSLPGRRVRIFDITFSPDSSRVVAGTADGHLRVWDVAARAVLAEFKAHRSITNVRFSPDGAVIASAGSDAHVRLWNASDWSLRAEIDTGRSSARMVRFTPDGRLLLANNERGTLVFIEPTTGAVLHSLTDEAGCWALAISPDGRTYALGDGERRVRIFDMASRAPLRTLHGHREIVWSIAYSQDGALMASQSPDGMIRIWDTATGRGLMTLAADDQGMVFPFAFIPTDPAESASARYRLVTGHGFRGAAIWDFAYFDRFVAGNAEHQLRRLEHALTPDEVSAARQWARDLEPPPSPFATSRGFE
jgi:WD40 repeat protein